MTPMASIVKYSAVAVLGVALVGCTTKKTEPPAPSGPSEFATSLQLTASPDVLSQDGHSESQITIIARDPNSQPLRNLALRADIVVNGTIVDFGTLSQKHIATGSDGRATLVYRAPEGVDNVDRNTTVNITVTPSSGDAAGTTARSVSIRLVPTGTVGGETPVPDFQFSPAVPKQLESITFDASSAVLDSSLVKYEWDFGDGSKGSGRVASHQYRDVGFYTVTLTVTDVTGRKGSRSKSVGVDTSGLPVGAFIFSPAEPGIGEEIVFNASSSTAVSPRVIVKYEWQFGTDRTGSGMIVTKRYDTPGTYIVSLKVTDDAGNVGTASQPVSIGTTSPGGLTAQFTVSPTDPVAGTEVVFNANTSTSSTSITKYEWDFGDSLQAPKPRVTTNPRTTWTFANPGAYVVTLRIVDSQGRSATTTKEVSVAEP